MTAADATAAAVVVAARAWLGTPYRHGAALRGIGCDCLGLVRGVWRDVYGAEPEAPPPYGPAWSRAEAGEVLAAAAGRHCAPVVPSAARPGDLVLFRWRDGLPARHCGILVASGRMIHAHDGACVAEVALGPWARRLAFAFRFPPLATAEARP